VHKENVTTPNRQSRERAADADQTFLASQNLILELEILVVIHRSIVGLIMQATRALSAPFVDRNVRCDLYQKPLRIDDRLPGLAFYQPRISRLQGVLRKAFVSNFTLKSAQ